VGMEQQSQNYRNGKPGLCRRRMGRRRQHDLIAVASSGFRAKVDAFGDVGKAVRLLVSCRTRWRIWCCSGGRIAFRADLCLLPRELAGAWPLPVEQDSWGWVECEAQRAVGEWEAEKLADVCYIGGVDEQVWQSPVSCHLSLYVVLLLTYYLHL